MKNRLFPMVSALVLTALLLAVLAGGGWQPASAAPVPAITPVAATLPIGGSDTALIKFYDAESLTADDQECRDLQEWRVMDLEYLVDQTLVSGETNTTTVTLEHTNGVTALTTNTTGQTVVSANAADADDLNRFDLYGRYTCVDINVTNSNAVTWTVYAVVRK